MKIIFLSYSYWPPTFGGGLIRMVQTMQSLVQRGHDVIVLTSGAPTFPAEEMRDGLHVLRSPIVGNTRLLRGIRRLVCSLWMFRKLLLEKYDLVHFGGFPGINSASSWFIGYILALVVKWKGAQSVYTYTLADTVDDPISLQGFSGRLKALFLNEVSVIVGISPALKTAILKKFPNKQSTFIPNGVRDDIFVPLSETERDQIRLDLGLSLRSVVFAFLGSLGYRKGFDVLAEAFVDLSTEYPDWQLLVIGPMNSGENKNVIESEVEEVVDRVRSHPNVTFVGRVDDRVLLARMIGGSDVFVFPSRLEGMPNAPMEAMAAGVPPIIARLPGITDMANIGGETGLYVPPGDVEALKAAMEKLGINEQLRMTMGKKARERIVNDFGWNAYVSKWEQLYKDLS